VATPSRDAALLQIFDEYLAANADYRRLYAIYDRGRKKHQAKYPMPEVVRVQPGDEELGLPEGYPHPTLGMSYVGRIELLQCPGWPVLEDLEAPEGLRKGRITRFERPSAAARARVDEIVAAHDKWEAKYTREPREVRLIERQAGRADKLKDKLRAKIDRTRAHTIAGLAVKAQVAAIEGEDDTQFADTTLASILRDMKALRKAGLS
jgi:hypothetical protein